MISYHMVTNLLLSHHSRTDLYAIHENYFNLNEYLRLNQAWTLQQALNNVRISVTYLNVFSVTFLMAFCT